MKDTSSYKAEISALGRIAQERVPPTMRAEAERLAARLSGPVRVALVGEKGAGKSSLLSFLLGDSLMPDGLPPEARPTVIVAHANAPQVVAGWWDGRISVHQGRATGAALARKPDFLEIGLPLQVLETMSFLDMPTAEDPERRLRQLKWLYPRADMLLWCKPARQPWAPDETKVWLAAPASLRGVSLLVATHADQLTAETFAEVAARFARDTGDSFHKIIPIATSNAIAAAPGGEVRDVAAWKASGAMALLRALVGCAKAVRERQIAAARKVIAAAEAPSASPSEAATPTSPQAAPAASPTAAPEVPPQQTPQPSPPEPPPLAADRPPAEAEVVPETPAPTPEPAEDKGQALAKLAALQSAAKEEKADAPAPEAAKKPTSPVSDAPPPTMSRFAAKAEAARIRMAGGVVPDEILRAAGELGAPEAAPAAPAPGPAAEAPAEGPVETPTEATPSRGALSRPENAILAMMDDVIGGLIAAGEQDALEDETVLYEAARLLDELSFMIADPTAMAPDTLWINEAVEVVADHIAELRAEGAPGSGEEAARLLLQLSKDLSWSVAA